MLNEVGVMHYLLGFLVGVVFGSIPGGLWIVQAIHGIDIREYGSKNIGTTNVFRTVGHVTASMVLLCDVLKGVVAIIATNYFFHNPMLNMFVAMGALIGHNYSIFLGFKGGKGVATGIGLLTYLMPCAAAGVSVVWFALVGATRYVSLGSIVGAALAPLFAWYFDYPVPYISFAAFSAFFVVLRHKENIIRLLNGTESKIKEGNAKDLHK